MKLWRIETQDGASLIVFRDVMVSTFKFGGNRIFFGVDTADFVGCRGATRAIRFPVVCDIPVSDVIVLFELRGLGMGNVYVFCLFLFISLLLLPACLW